MSRIIGRTINPLVGLAAEAYQHNKEKRSKSQQRRSSDNAGEQSQLPGGYQSKQPTPGDYTALTPLAQSDVSQDLPPAYADLPSKQRSRSPSHSSDNEDSDDGDSSDDDEDDWARDATQDELEPSSEAAPGTDVKKYISEMFNRHPDHLRGAPYPPLPCPVIMPQRRPNAKSRGFVRAYAPVLKDSGIDESLFLDFINGFERAIRGQGAFTAFNIAVAISVMAETIAAGSVDPIIHFSALAMHISVEAGRRVYESVKTNTYLDQMNELLFKPHGLYAMIMSYKPGSRQISQVADMNNNTISAVAAHEGGRSKLRASAGKATDDQIPECAPLIFPALERAGDEEKANAFKRSMAFITDYQDRRAQATWQQKNPDSRLNVPGAEPRFSASIGDPRHTANQGGIINLLTGGRAGGRRRERRAHKAHRREERGQLRAARRGVEYSPPARQQVRAAQRQQMGIAPDDPRSDREVRREFRQRRKDQGLTPISYVKRTLGESVLYLIIVSLPTEAEMAEAVAMTKKCGIFD